jgi:predicted ATPase with chaperone activity
MTEATFAGRFFPHAPTTIEATGLSEAHIEGLVIKLLTYRGGASGWQIAEQLRLPLPLIADLLRRLKDTQLIAHAGAAQMNDFVYRITDRGRELARHEEATSTYIGAAPVPLADYVVSVRTQAPRLQSPTSDEMRQALDGLLVNERLMARLGPAINAGRAMFLYGSSGNGKSSIAARLAAAYHEELWIPRAILVGTTVLRLFDPTRHVELRTPEADSVTSDGAAAGAAELAQPPSASADARWVRIQRPTIVAGGELTLEQLSVSVDPASGVGEAPLQLKSNCGTLVVDDFGRQLVEADELLNRWMVPLEQHHDFLHMPDGKIVEIPFEQFVVFSTNLEPRALVDEAFLRRIPYKIQVGDPTEEEFHELFRMVGAEIGVEYDHEAVAGLISRHYLAKGRPMRFCHPRDLMRHVVNEAEYSGVAPEMTEVSLDMAAEGYFVL